MALQNNGNPKERRKFGRRETSYAAWIRIPGKPSQVCVVRDLSITGALLQCEYPRTLPFWFELVIPATNSRFYCEARHCTDTTIGVEFGSLEKLEVGDLDRRLQQDPSRVSVAQRVVRQPGLMIEAMKG